MSFPAPLSARGTLRDKRVRRHPSPASHCGKSSVQPTAHADRDDGALGVDVQRPAEPAPGKARRKTPIIDLQCEGQSLGQHVASHQVIPWMGLCLATPPCLPDVRSHLRPTAPRARADSGGPRARRAAAAGPVACREQVPVLGNTAFPGGLRVILLQGLVAACGKGLQQDQARGA